MGDFQEALTALLGKDAPNLSPAPCPRTGGGRRGTRLLEGPGGGLSLDTPSALLVPQNRQCYQ